MEGEKTRDTVGSKLKPTFAVFVMFVLMAAVAIVFLGIEIPSQQQQTSQEKQQGSDIESSIPELVGLAEDLESQGLSFLEKTKTATIDESQGEQLEYNYFSRLNCNQLSNIASSFENGWGRALAEFSARCENSDDIIP